MKKITKYQADDETEFDNKADGTQAHDAKTYAAMELEELLAVGMRANTFAATVHSLIENAREAREILTRYLKCLPHEDKGEILPIKTATDAPSNQAA